MVYIVRWFFFFIRICRNILSGISKSGQKIDLIYHLGPYIRVNNNYNVIRDVLHMISTDRFIQTFRCISTPSLLSRYHWWKFLLKQFHEIFFFFLILPSSCYLFEVWSVTNCMAWGMMKWGFFSVEFRELGEIIKTQCSQINEKVWNFRKSWSLKCDVTNN